MNAMDVAATGDAGPAGSGDTGKVPPLLGRKSVLMGMLASGFVVANAAQPSEAAGSVKLGAIVATTPADVTTWAPGTAYVLGQQVISPGNDVVSANVAHTSSAGFVTDTVKWSLSSTYIAKGSQFISAADTGLSTGASGAANVIALQAAIDLAKSSGIPEVRVTKGGTYNFATSVTLAPKVALRGTGMNVTLNYTGSGSFLVQPTPGTRIYDVSLSNLYITGPGTGGSTVGVNLDSVSMARLENVVVKGFSKGIRIASAVSGGAVFNTLLDVTAGNCGTGFSIEADGSNATRFLACRANACTTGLSITDSNNTTWVGGQIESCGTGVYITATSAALSDNNLIDSTRFEGNTTAWNIASPFVRFTQIVNPASFGTYTYTDAGSTTTHWGGGGSDRNWTASTAQDALGSYRFTRAINGGAETPALVVSDPVTTSGTPVTLQIETGRSAGFFLRGKQSGSTKAEITATGQGRFVAGIGVGNSAAATTPGSVVKKIQVFDATGTSLGYIAVYASIT